MRCKIASIRFVSCLLVSGVSLVVSLNTAFAECVPTVDACAPQKKLDAWDTSVNGGFNMTSGNSDTLLLTIGAAAHRDENNDIWDFAGAYGYGKDDNIKDGENGSTTRNDIRAKGSYDHLLNDRLFVGLGAKYLYDQIAEIDYRVNTDPSIGYYILRDNSFKFRVEGGPSYVFEKVDGETNNYLAPRLANRFEYAITCTSKVYELAEVLFDVNDSQNYIVNAEVGVESALSSNLALVLTLRQNYDNQPAPDKDKSDVAVISSLKVSL